MMPEFNAKECNIFPTDFNIQNRPVTIKNKTAKFTMKTSLKAPARQQH